MVGFRALDPDKLRNDFPILQRKINGKPLVYLDNAATSQKPVQVIEAIKRYYEEYNANIHRAVHQLSVEATEAFEEARKKVANFINAKRPEEIIFVRGTTEAINLARYSWGCSNIGADDRVLITDMEHHSNIVPWQLLCKERNAHLDYMPIDDDGYLVTDKIADLMTRKTRLFSFAHVSNVLGTINPVKDLVKYAHQNDTPVLLDAAQSVPCMPIDVQQIDCDFLAFSGHKMLGPTGIGVLYVKYEFLEKMEPFLGGGDMIKEVHKYDSRWNDLPWKFEAGTSNIAGAIGLGVAIDYLKKIGMDNVLLHEREMAEFAMRRLIGEKGVKLYGPRKSSDRAAVFSFNLEGIHPHDLGTIMDDEGIAIRTGHHCAQVLMERIGVGISGTARASLYIYNTKGEIDRLLDALGTARKIFVP